MKPQVNAISNRLSLRSPQREALEILDRLCEIIPLDKRGDANEALKIIRSEYPSVADFERDFPSLCFALATGVGKTRLMGAFIAYLHQAEGIRHFFVLAPNLTIYNKLIADFTPNTPKYVFQGIADFAINPPEVITGDNYESGRGVRNDRARQLRLDGSSDVVHINIFNVSKINSEVRGGKAPRIKRLQEYIGESYFEYLSKLDDLVLLMDESHRYRASAGVKAINELKPILGLELTATPQIEAGNNTIPFKNVIYNYPLSSALKDGFVKEPAVATRDNFDPKNYDEAGLEKLKLEDGVRIHEDTKVQLEVYARQANCKMVKPFVLVVAQNIEHAKALVEKVSADTFFDGRYKGRVMTVHSGQSAAEEEEMVRQLLSVEDPSNPTEIVVHVNMLKEGWDVTNLYTIVPLRAANSKTLVEQSIGRGLRLPYGKRTGVAAVDRLTIVSHDRFQEIVDEANKPDSVIRQTVVLGKDIPEAGTEVVVLQSRLATELRGASKAAPITGAPKQTPLFSTPKEQKAAETVLSVIRQFESLPRSADLQKPEVQAAILEQVTAAMAPLQGEIPGTEDKIDLAEIVAKATALYIEMSIDIPRIVVVPTGEVTSGFRDFDLEVSGIHLQPVAKDILIQHLHDHARYRLVGGDGIVPEKRLEDYLVRGLIDFNDVSYDDHAELLYKLAGQVVARLQSYLKEEDDIRNVLQYHQKSLVDLIHAQMQSHYEEKATNYEVKVSKGFIELRDNGCSKVKSETVRDYRTPVEEKLLIRGMLFGGFRRCLYDVQQFQSDTERRFAALLERDDDVLKWFKPARGNFQIHYRGDDNYEPDFVVETKTRKFLCEPKRASEITDGIVLDKARAASLWCEHATAHGGKPWTYLLIPHDAITDNKTLEGLAAAYTFKATKLH